MFKQLFTKTTDAFTVLDPENRENLNYFSRKWGYSISEIKQAILYTGTLDPHTICEYLRRDSFIYHPVKGIREFIETTRQLIF